jgi:hypothetical protein
MVVRTLPVVHSWRDGREGEQGRVVVVLEPEKPSIALKTFFVPFHCDGLSSHESAHGTD